MVLTVSIAAAQVPSQTAGTSRGQDPFQAAEKEAEQGSDRKVAKKSEPQPEFVRKTAAEWQRVLPRAVFMVTRLKATEPAFSGRYAMGHFHGTFVCACCEAELFSSRQKFDSGTGWPSFWQPIADRAIDRAVDHLEAEPRIEVMCHRCGAHLGHVFDDGPPPTGLRFCINSLSLKLKPTGGTGKAASEKPRTSSRGKTAKTKTKNAMISTRAKGTSKTANPQAKAPENEKPSDPGTSSTGKTGGA